MIIGIDGSRLSVVQRTGTENYTAQIIIHLARLAAPDILRVYLRTAETPDVLRDLPNVDPVAMPFPRFWTHLRLSREMMLRPPDVLFVPSHVVPLAHPRTVVTIHDLGYLHYPTSHPPGQRRMLDLTTRWSVHTARHILAISESTRRDLAGAYGLPAAKISVVPHGTEQYLQVDQHDVDETLKRLKVTAPYVLTVGTVQPRKNLIRLVEAMNDVAERGLPHILVIAGKPGWLSEDVMNAVRAADQLRRTMFLGFVSPGDLHGLYAAADGFALLSLYEGFGMPALDALAAGIPTLLSDRSALPEVGGSAAIYVNPLDTAQIGQGLIRLLTDVDLRARLRGRGPEQAARFNWDATASATLAVLRAAAS